MRLAKYLAHAGIASRRASEDLIAAGRVTVDGATQTDPATDVDDTNDIAVDGEPTKPEPRVVYLLNKPKGVVSTAKDTHNRPTVVDLISSSRRLYPVGRLDANTTGLILLTNDGELANRLMHPSSEVPRTYRAQIANGPVSNSALERLRIGIDLDDGRTSPAKARQIRRDLVEITIKEGRKRQVRRMCEAIGHPVTSLTRIALGPLELKGLEPGAHRRITPAELDALWNNPRP